MSEIHHFILIQTDDGSIKIEGCIAPMEAYNMLREMIENDKIEHEHPHTNGKVKEIPPVQK